MGKLCLQASTCAIKIGLHCSTVPMGQSLLFLLKFGIALAFFSFFFFLLFVMDVNRDSLFLGGMLTKYL